MESILENISINRMIRSFTRSPNQLNFPHLSDSELLFVEGYDKILAITTDTIVEEIEYGLYKDPYLIGYMTVLVNISDLSAVGASPLGILLNQVIPSDVDSDFLEQIQQGIQDACKKAGTFVLGGDTNYSDRIVMGATAIGHVEKPVTRQGTRPGEYLYVSGPLGAGAALALANYTGTHFDYLPVIRTKESIVMGKYATCCMDTSDGLLYTLNQLKSINSCGFNIDLEMKFLLDPAAFELSQTLNLPSWLFLNGPHGEFELLFTVPAYHRSLFEMEAQTIGWSPILIGKITREKEVTIAIRSMQARIDTDFLQNEWTLCKGDLASYLHRLKEYDQNLFL